MTATRRKRPITETHISDMVLYLLALKEAHDKHKNFSPTAVMHDIMGKVTYARVTQALKSCKYLEKEGKVNKFLLDHVEPIHARRLIEECRRMDTESARAKRAEAVKPHISKTVESDKDQSQDESRKAYIENEDQITHLDFKEAHIKGGILHTKKYIVKGDFIIIKK